MCVCVCGGASDRLLETGTGLKPYGSPGVDERGPHKALENVQTFVVACIVFGVDLSPAQPRFPFRPHPQFGRRRFRSAGLGRRW